MGGFMGGFTEPKRGRSPGPAAPGPHRPRRSLTSTGNRTRPTVNTARAHVTAGPAPPRARPAPAALPLGAAPLLTIYGQVLPSRGRWLAGPSRHSTRAESSANKAWPAGSCGPGGGRAARRRGEQELQVPAAPRRPGRTAPPRAAVGGAGRAP